MKRWATDWKDIFLVDIYVGEDIYPEYVKNFCQVKNKKDHIIFKNGQKSYIGTWWHTNEHIRKIRQPP